ncbi:hypothetical protein ACO0LF_09280 [Undibacterium sp. Di27W]|uniref:hypothetical protein n=1 Tax=Undibacterium sp. Di27W TaxID=3413036 RepID=UPI003BEFB54D
MRRMQVFLLCLGLLSSSYAQALALTMHVTIGDEKPPEIRKVETAILMVNIQKYDSSTASTPAFKPFKPYSGVLARAPYLDWIVMLCACLLPLGMLVVTTVTLIDFRKRRNDDDVLSCTELIS